MVSEDLKLFWREIQSLTYVSGFINYEHNNFEKIGLKYGLYSKCCNEIYDILEEKKFCHQCGKKLSFN